MISDFSGLSSYIMAHRAFAKHQLIGSRGFTIPNFAKFTIMEVTSEGVGQLRAKGIVVTGDLGRGNLVAYDDALRYLNVRASFFGRANCLLVLGSDKLKLDIRMRESETIAVFGNTNRVSNFEVYMIGAGSGLFLGSRGSSVGTRFHLEGADSSVIVADEHMLSWNVDIRNQDGHGIFDVKTRRVLSGWRDVIVEPHVWIGFDSAVLKGVRIGSGSIIGAKSLVAKSVPRCSIFAGNPAVLRRSDVTWTRSNLVPDDQVREALVWAEHYETDTEASIQISDRKKAGFFRRLLNPTAS